MLVYNNYETDNRVRRYAETLVKRGDQVDVIAVSGGNLLLERPLLMASLSITFSNVRATNGTNGPMRGDYCVFRLCPRFI